MASTTDAAAEDSASSASSALDRAERARRNGARSRGPRTAEGKARSSRNALTHGLTAKVHLLQHGEDAPAFQGLTTRLFAELAPTGEVDGFLVANLAAAMWRTGRAHQLEGIACDGPSGLDERRLGLALRYHGSASRELFRSLRALADLRRRPLAAQPAADIAENQPPTATVPGAIPAVAHLAWGGACPPAPPPGCLMLRPVPGKAPRSWRHWQHDAFPGAEPVPVDAAGVAYALVGGAWVPQAPPEPAPEPPPPPTVSGVDTPPRTPEPADSATVAVAATLRHNLTLADLAAPTDPDRSSAVDADPESCPPDDTQRRNEPRMLRVEPAESDEDDPGAGTRSAIAPGLPTDDPSKWYLMWGLAPPEPQALRLPYPDPDDPTADDRLLPNQISPPPGRTELAPAPEPSVTAPDRGPSPVELSRVEPTPTAPRPRSARFRPLTVAPRRYLGRSGPSPGEAPAPEQPPADGGAGDARPPPWPLGSAREPC